MPARRLDTDAAEVTYARLRALADAVSTDDEARAVAAELRAFARRVRAARWRGYPWQHPHVHPEGWVSLRAPGKQVCDERCLDLPRVEPGVHEAWLQRGGRGTGKTEGAAHYVNTHAEGPPCDPRVPGGHRFTIVAPTQPDAVSSCVTGVSGLQAMNPGVTVTTTKEGTIVRWPNGVIGRVLGAHEAGDVERARAWTNVCLWWLEEAAAQNHLGGMLEQAPFTLRLGARPHMVITTTPRNRPEILALIEGTANGDLPHIKQAPIQTWGRTEDADRLPDAVRQSYESMFRGTTLGRQELDGDLLGDVEGALWVMERPDLVDGALNTDDRPGINNDRVPGGHIGWTPHGDIADLRLVLPTPERQATLDAIRATLPPPPENPAVTLDRAAIGVDPSGGATETGIVGVGSHAQHGYIFADLTTAAGPDGWGMVAVLAWYHYGAEGIALERTYGGNNTDHVISTAAEALGLPMPALLRAPTPEGKTARAVPVQMLGQQHRLHNVGVLPLLETEMTTYVEGETEESPNRLDAMVHAVRHLLVRAKAAHSSNAVGRRSLPTTGARMPSRGGIRRTR